MKKKILTSLLAVLLVPSVFAITEPKTEVMAYDYNDSDYLSEDVRLSDWFAPAVEFVTSNEYMYGFKGYFAPHDNATRSQASFAVFSIEYINIEDLNSYLDLEFSFTDHLNHSDKWCLTNGIMSGYNDTTFGGEDNITREQFAVILRNLTIHQGKDASYDLSLLNSFTDSSKISSWSTESVAWAVSKGLMSGYNNILNPQGFITRAELATMIKNYCDNI